MLAVAAFAAGLFALGGQASAPKHTWWSVFRYNTEQPRADADFAWKAERPYNMIALRAWTRRPSGQKAELGWDVVCSSPRGWWWDSKKSGDQWGATYDDDHGGGIDRGHRPQWSKTPFVVTIVPPKVAPGTKCYISAYVDSSDEFVQLHHPHSRLYVEILARR